MFASMILLGVLKRMCLPENEVFELYFVIYRENVYLHRLIHIKLSNTNFKNLNMQSCRVHKLLPLSKFPGRSHNLWLRSGGSPPPLWFQVQQKQGGSRTTRVA